MTGRSTQVIPLRTGRSRPVSARGWEPWEGVRGGRIWTAEDGTKSYYIRKSVRGQLFQAKLVGTDPVALADQLRRFWADPAGFDARGARFGREILLDAALIDEYVRWCSAVPVGRTHPRCESDWLKKKRSYLDWWKERLDGRDLRALHIGEIKEHLKCARNHKQSVSVIKHLYTFLREDKNLKVSEDPTFAVLKTPQSEPAQWRASKAEFTREHFEAVIAWLDGYGTRTRRDDGSEDLDVAGAAEYLGLSPQTVRAYHGRGLLRSLTGGGRGRRLAFARESLDEFLLGQWKDGAPHRVALANIVLAGTAWHSSEVVRFSLHGKVDELPASHRRQNGAAKVLVCEHKGKFLHPTPVTEEAASAAEELVAVGGVSMDELYRWTKKAVDATGAPKFAPGQYRHTVSTHAGNQGTDDRDISKFLGHKTEVTAKRFYTTRQVPPKIPTFI